MNKNFGCSISNSDDSPKIKLIGDSVVPLMHMINKNRIFVRISASHCWTCVKNISDVIKQNNTDNIEFIYLIDKFDNEILNVFKNFTNIENESLYIISDSISLPIENQHIPYLFSVKENNQINRLLIPVENDTLLIKDFINTINN